MARFSGPLISRDPVFVFVLFTIPIRQWFILRRQSIAWPTYFHLFLFLKFLDTGVDWSPFYSFPDKSFYLFVLFIPPPPPPRERTNKMAVSRAPPGNILPQIYARHCKREGLRYLAAFLGSCFARTAVYALFYNA